MDTCTCTTSEIAGAIARVVMFMHKLARFRDDRGCVSEQAKKNYGSNHIKACRSDILWIIDGLAMATYHTLLLFLLAGSTSTMRIATYDLPTVTMTSHAPGGRQLGVKQPHRKVLTVLVL
jgi:hypothetical protein